MFKTFLSTSRKQKVQSLEEIVTHMPVSPEQKEIYLACIEILEDKYLDDFFDRIKTQFLNFEQEILQQE